MIGVKDKLCVLENVDSETGCRKGFALARIVPRARSLIAVYSKDIKVVTNRLDTLPIFAVCETAREWSGGEIMGHGM